MGNSWLRSRTNGNVSASGCGEPIPPSVFLADAEQRRAQRAVTAWPRAVVVRLHPSASPGDEVLQEERLACTEEERVRLPPSPLPALGLGGTTIRTQAARRNMTMSGSHDEMRGRELAMTWELDLDYLTIA